MASDLSKDQMLAILAMDSYNRWYNQSLDIDSIKTIGTATFSTDSSRIPGLESTRDSGFYAVQYSWDGKTVISYRGTDNDGVFAKTDKGASDIWSGWSIGTGYANASQATSAEKFYKAVTGQEVDAATAPSNVILTGHSLGGGLAGYVAALARTNAVVARRRGVPRRAQRRVRTWADHRPPDWTCVPCAVSQRGFDEVCVFRAREAAGTGFDRLRRAEATPECRVERRMGA